MGHRRLRLVHQEPTWLSPPSHFPLFSPSSRYLPPPPTIASPPTNWLIAWVVRAVPRAQWQPYVLLHRSALRSTRRPLPFRVNDVFMQMVKISSPSALWNLQSFCCQWSVRRAPVLCWPPGYIVHLHAFVLTKYRQPPDTKPTYVCISCKRFARPSIPIRFITTLAINVRRK